MISATLQSVEKLNDTTFTFWLKPSQPVDYTAGQFVEIFLPHEADDRGTHRWFTLSSSPSEALLAITTRKASRQSTFKQALFDLKPGDNLQISQAMGDFVLPMQKSLPLIFLVRGIGITPVRSILKLVNDTGTSRSIYLVYSAKQTQDVLFTELIKSTVNHADFIELHASTDVGLPVKTTLDHIKKTPDARVYISGPEQFVEKAYPQLLAAGLKPSSIITDYFHGYEG